MPMRRGNRRAGGRPTYSIQSGSVPAHRSAEVSGPDPLPSDRAEGTGPGRGPLAPCPLGQSWPQPRIGVEDKQLRSGWRPYEFFAGRICERLQSQRRMLEGYPPDRGCRRCFASLRLRRSPMERWRDPRASPRINRLGQVQGSRTAEVLAGSAVPAPSTPPHGNTHVCLEILVLLNTLTN